MAERIALVGAFPTRDMLMAHVKWMDDHGPHDDGWEQRNVLDFEGDLQREIAEHGAFHLYAYLSPRAGGEGRIEYRARVTKLVTFPAGPVPFQHPVHAWDGKARSIMTFSSFQKWSLVLGKLTSYDGKPLDKRRLLNECLPIVDPNPIAP